MLACHSRGDIAEMTVSDQFLYSESHIKSLSDYLTGSIKVQKVRFCILHNGKLMNTDKALFHPLYSLPVTVEEVEVPEFTFTSHGYWSHVARAMVVKLSQQLRDRQAYLCH